MTPWGWIKRGLGAYRFWTSRHLGRVLFPKLMARRDAKRAARKAAKDAAGGEFISDDKETSLAINTGLRSSSNSAIAAVVVNVLVAIVHGVAPDFTIPSDWLVYLTGGVMWVVSRFTKTPEGAGVV